MKRLWPIFVFALAWFYACQVNLEQAGQGCGSDADCRNGRVCADRVCRYERDAERMVPAEYTARIVFQALKEQNIGRLDTAYPIQADYAWGFELTGGVGVYNETMQNYMDIHRAALDRDFEALLEEADLSQAEYVRFEPGSYEPIPTGKQKNTRDLDRLKDSKLVYAVGGEEESLVIPQLVHLRNRWVLFDLKE